MQFQSNPQLQLAFEFVHNTDKNIFLTGKAGTGKTTFLLQLKQQAVKRMVVVAPTGVAAINAGGMTIHSFFQLPFGLYLPGQQQDANQQRKFSREKIRLIQSLDLVVIDEISMVRADLLDAIDAVLRRYKDHYRPFGGVQMLMIGDLHQLPPVVKEEDWGILRTVYQTPYFFSSQAWQKTDSVAIELKHIYRQSDDTFINLLNKVRDNRIDADVLTVLNSRYVPGFQPGNEEPYITLTAHNASAQDINAQKLAEIPNKVLPFKAVIKDEFPAQAFPAEEILELKLNAQVMFVRNDQAREKRYYNGKIGKITRIQGENIYVQCPDEAEEIAVLPVEWENVKYNLNETTKEVTEQVIGTFTQYPLRLAWAITIHKSQGLTFERAIIDAQAAFAHGQVYVALSRCKSFEGIVLRSKIESSSVRTDLTVRHYTQEADKNTPDEDRLNQSKSAFQQSLIRDLFDFSVLKRRFDQTYRVFLEHEKAFLTDLKTPLLLLRTEAENHIFDASGKFSAQLPGYFAHPGFPEDLEMLQERIRKASAWFVDKLSAILLPAAQNIRILTDNKAVQKAGNEALENLQKEIFVKNACFAAMKDGFSTHGYLRAKANAGIDFQADHGTTAQRTGSQTAPANTPHPALYNQLKNWRSDMAASHNVEPHQVMPTKSLLELVRHLPVSPGALKKIKGIGAVKSAQFGAELIDLILNHCTAHQIETSDLALVADKPVKPETKSVSLDLYRAGQTIDEIAATRGMARSTIEGHLAHFVGQGDLDVFEFLDEGSVRALESFFTDKETRSSGEAKSHFGDTYSYGQIKMVIQYLERQQGE
jgi:hypothetical protein